MDYFVSVEDSFYMRWQIALLQESMTLLGIENDLVLGVCNLQPDSPFRQIRHVEVENLGRKFDYPPLNKPVAVKMAIDSGLIKQPFNLIDPDMVLVEKLKEYSSPVAGHKSSLMEPNNIKKMGYENYLKDEWVDIGCIYQFNDVDPILFDNVINTLHIMLSDDIKYLDGPSKWQKEMVAFAGCLAGYEAELNVLESAICPIYADYVEGVPVLHYSNGFLPFFNKRMHTGNRIISLAEHHFPYSTIAALPCSSCETNCAYFHSNVGKKQVFGNTIRFKQITESLVKRLYENEKSV